MRRLFGVADVKFDVIRAFERQKILLGCRSTFLFWSSNCRCHKLPPRFLALSAFFKYKIDNPPSQGRRGGWIGRSVGRCYRSAAMPRSFNNAQGTARSTLFRVFRRERGDDFFEARIAPQRVPDRHEFQLAIAEAARAADGYGKLFAGEIFVTNPRSDHRQIFDQVGAMGRIFFHGKKLDRAPAFAKRFLFPAKTSVDQTKEADRGLASSLVIRAITPSTNGRLKNTFSLARPIGFSPDAIKALFAAAASRSASAQIIQRSAMLCTAAGFVARIESII